MMSSRGLKKSNQNPQPSRAVESLRANPHMACCRKGSVEILDGAVLTCLTASCVMPMRGHMLDNTRSICSKFDLSPLWNLAKNGKRQFVSPFRRVLEAAKRQKVTSIDVPGGWRIEDRPYFDKLCLNNRAAGANWTCLNCFRLPVCQASLRNKTLAPYKTAKQFES